MSTKSEVKDEEAVTTTTEVVTPAAPTPPVKEPSRGFFNNISNYALELTVAMIVMLMAMFVLIFSTYSLFNTLQSLDNASYTGLWWAASTLVWLPVLVIFYLRSHSYMARNPQVVMNGTQRAFVITYQVFVVLVGIGYAFAAVYSLLTAFVASGNVGEVLLNVTVPSLIAALICGGAFIAFFKKPVMSRYAYTWSLIAVVLLLIIPTITMNVIGLRQQNKRNQDTQRQYKNNYNRSNNDRYNNSYDYNTDRNYSY